MEIGSSKQLEDFSISLVLVVQVEATNVRTTTHEIIMMHEKPTIERNMKSRYQRYIL